MPELPEVEHLRRSLDPWLVGSRFSAVRLARKSVVVLDRDEPRNTVNFRVALGVGDSVVGTDRRGKQMAIAFASGRFLVVQLGMTGSVTIEQDKPPQGVEARHRHVVWECCSTAGPIDSLPWRLVFRDP